MCGCVSLTGIQQLEVDQVAAREEAACNFWAIWWSARITGEGVGNWQSDLSEQVDQVVGELVVGLVTVADLVVPQFKLCFAP